MYDIKGVGGGSLVVAAGSVRDSGEVYTCIDGSPVVSIPEWLVDWLLADFQKYRRQLSQTSSFGKGYVGASAEAVAVGASAPDDAVELFLNRVPHCEQNGAVRSTSEPHCWHRSICNGSPQSL